MMEFLEAIEAGEVPSAKSMRHLESDSCSGVANMLLGGGVALQRAGDHLGGAMAFKASTVVRLRALVIEGKKATKCDAPDPLSLGKKLRSQRQPQLKASFYERLKKAFDEETRSDSSDRALTFRCLALQLMSGTAFQNRTRGSAEVRSEGRVYVHPPPAF